MPKRSNKRGLKAFSLTDSKKDYTYNWTLYAGRYISSNIGLIILPGIMLTYFVGKDDTIDVGENKTVHMVL